MQLFISDYSLLSPTELNIENPLIINQIRKVLRGKIGDQFCIQAPIVQNFPMQDLQNMMGGKKSVSTRYTCTISAWDKHSLRAEINKKEEYNIDPNAQTIMLIAMTNKRTKAELIVQKLTEI